MAGQASGTLDAGFNFRGMVRTFHLVIFSFIFDICILCIFFSLPSALGECVLVCRYFQMASSCSDLISLCNHAVLIHFSASLSYQLQILKCLFPSLMIYTLEHHSKYCDLVVYSCLQVLWRPVRQPQHWLYTLLNDIAEVAENKSSRVWSDEKGVDLMYRLFTCVVCSVLFPSMHWMCYSLCPK